MDLLGTLLEKFHIPYTRVDGRVSYSERSERLASFQNTCGISVLLMTFGSGALGYRPLVFRVFDQLLKCGLSRLNLSSANRIHIVEPQWNPMVEDQAIGRALRLGQKREVTIIRYVMDDTIEQVLLALPPVLFLFLFVLWLTAMVCYRALSRLSKRRKAWRHLFLAVQPRIL